MNNILKVHDSDNVIAALVNLNVGDLVTLDGEQFEIKETIPMKHKFAAVDFAVGDLVIMYGVRIGKAKVAIPKGCRISTDNVGHSVKDYEAKSENYSWKKPDNSKFHNRTFDGYIRSDGKVGTRNYWIVFPLVFCENRNIKLIEETMLEALGYKSKPKREMNIDVLIDLYKNGASAEHLLETSISSDSNETPTNQLFPNVDGLKFLVHDRGCGEIRQDSEALCRLMAGYINNPNVAGATILSLGCQNAQFSLLQKAMNAFGVATDKPIYILEQQKSNSERDFIEEAIKKTFVGLIEANKIQRQPAPLSKLTLGLECGGSDGFSGISANPALGYASDLLVTLGGTTILAEFPELNGVEQELINRCDSVELAAKFSNLMSTYSKRAEEAGSGFEMNPSPGNIKDGLITDAMKSAGAAKKGGISNITDILDYTEQATKPGLNLLCTPGNDVESTTALAGTGCNIMAFTTGLGTPTGNPISPVIKISSNSILTKRMSDIIDLDAGTIISGEDTIQTKGEELIEMMIEVASGRTLTKSEKLNQNDFIPWRRGVSL
ncbi:MAG TPA: altronate dehydratase family protein [Saprospiraceae bacterium]|nr:altronate dehydratase family protein [Saprospiraceae bacterium]HPN69698.1 altronate dehydratase family protein [Saprospiraceae bacterium]